jgi:hypothetical protein
MDILQILSITLSLVVLVSVLEFIRRGVFKEKYALLWLFSSIALIIISLWRGLLDFTAGIFGFYYPPSFLFLLGLGFLLLITLHYSIVVSILTDKNKKLAQELGILKEKLERVLDREKADTARVKNQ